MEDDKLKLLKSIKWIFKYWRHGISHQTDKPQHPKRLESEENQPAVETKQAISPLTTC